MTGVLHAKCRDLLDKSTGETLLGIMFSTAEPREMVAASVRLSVLINRFYRFNSMYSRAEGVRTDVVRER